MRTERILAILSFTGLILKFLHIPLGMELFVLSMSALIMAYCYGAFYFFSEKKIANQKLGLTIPSGIFFSVIITGILFKIQFWPGVGSFYLVMGVIATIILFVFIYFLQKKATSEELVLYYKKMRRRTIVMFSLSSFFLLISPSAVLKAEYRDTEEVRLREQLYFNKYNPKYEKQLFDYINKRDSLNAPKK